MSTKSKTLEIRIYGVNGSLHTFVQDDPAIADHILDDLHPSKIFASGRITIAGKHSITGFAADKVARVDFIKDDLACWDFPGDISDVVELSESNFRWKSGLDDPKHLEKREQTRQTGDYAIRFVDLEMLGGERTFLAVEIMVDLPADRLSRINFLLSGPVIHCRMRKGGVAILNLANMVRFTSYPGPSEAPSDAWPASHAD